MLLLLWRAKVGQVIVVTPEGLLVEIERRLPSGHINDPAYLYLYLLALP